MKNRVLISRLLAFALLVTSCLGIFIPQQVKADTSNILTVGPGMQYANPQAAFNAAVDGDTIEIYSDGVYYGEDAKLAIIGKSNLTIRGMNGRAQMIAQPGLRLTWGKAIWVVVSGSNITIENIEFQDASNDEKNGAGIKVDPDTSGSVTLKNRQMRDLT